MAITPPAFVSGVTRTPAPFGLFSVVLFREGSPDRWESGVEFESLGCLTEFQGIGELDCDTGTAEGLPKNLTEGGLEAGSAGTFMVYETYVCSPIGNSLEYAEQTARMRLEAREEIRVEQALSTGALGQSPNFADADEVTELDEAPDLATAIAELEQVLASEYGAQGILHMSRKTASLAIGKGAIESSGQRLRTKLGTPVIAGGGYTFEGIYATPAMFGYRSEILSSTNRAGDLLDRADNNLHGIAERNYLLAMDPCGIWHITFAEDAGGDGVDTEAREQIALLQTEVEDLSETVDDKANASDLTSLEGVVNSKADQTALDDGLAGKVSSVVAGDNIAVDDSDPENPVVSAEIPEP